MKSLFVQFQSGLMLFCIIKGAGVLSLSVSSLKPLTRQLKRTVCSAAAWIHLNSLLHYKAAHYSDEDVFLIFKIKSPKHLEKLWWVRTFSRQLICALRFSFHRDHLISALDAVSGVTEFVGTFINCLPLLYLTLVQCSWRWSKRLEWARCVDVSIW